MPSARLLAPGGPRGNHPAPGTGTDPGDPLWMRFETLVDLQLHSGSETPV